MIPAGMPANLPFVILDEFLLIPASGQEQRDLLELMEYRSGYASTIFCSQFMPEGWHERWGGSATAEYSFGYPYRGQLLYPGAECMIV